MATILTDGKKTVKITMNVWEGNGYSPDWSQDFFEIGILPRRETARDIEFIVEDVDYCIEQANDWAQKTGDFRDDEYPDTEDRHVDVEEIETMEGNEEKE